MSKETKSNTETMSMSNITFLGTSASINQWSTPEYIEMNEYEDRLEIIYKQFFLLSLNYGFSNQTKERVFKVIYSCKDGKWNKSKPIYGKIIPAQKETYEFEN